MKTSLEIYGKYGFHRYRKNISRVETDYLDEKKQYGIIKYSQNGM